MNNKTLFKLSLMCVLAAVSSPALAVGVITSATTIGNSSFAPSSNVQIDVNATTTAFAAASQHLNGNRIFYGTNADSKLYYSTKTTGSNTTVAVTATMVLTGFTSL